MTLPDLGRFASTDREGRFRFHGIRPGTHRVEARTADGDEASGTAIVPGGGVDLELGGGRKRAPAKKWLTGGARDLPERLPSVPSH